MAKSNKLINQAFNEAETIQASIFKNAMDTISEAFAPSLKSQFKEALREQTLSVTPAVGSDYDQDEDEANLVNPEDTLSDEGEGPEVIEDADLDNEIGDEDEIQTEEEDTFDLDSDITGDEPIDNDENEDEDFNLEDDEDPTEGENCDTYEDGDDLDLIDDDEHEGIDGGDLDISDDDEDDETEVTQPAESTIAKNESKQIKELKKQNTVLIESLNSLRKEFKKVNLFNVKMATAQKIVNDPKLSVKQKKKILESFDECDSVKEVQIVYKSYKNMLTESVAPKSNPKPATRKSFDSRGPKTTNKNGKNHLSEAERKSLEMAGILD